VTRAKVLLNLGRKDEFDIHALPRLAASITGSPMVMVTACRAPSRNLDHLDLRLRTGFSRLIPGWFGLRLWRRRRRLDRRDHAAHPFPDRGKTDEKGGERSAQQDRAIVSP
jgi:hypothetical protein